MQELKTCRWTYDKKRNAWKAGCDLEPWIDDTMLYHCIYCPNYGRRIVVDD